MSDSKEPLSKLVAVMRSAHKLDAEITPSDSWQQKVMAKVRNEHRSSIAHSRADSDTFSNPIFLRLSLCSLALTLVLQASYQFSPIEQTISVESLSELDPFDVTGVFDDDQ